MNPSATPVPHKGVGGGSANAGIPLVAEARDGCGGGGTFGRVRVWLRTKAPQREGIEKSYTFFKTRIGAYPCMRSSATARLCALNFSPFGLGFKVGKERDVSDIKLDS